MKYSLIKRFLSAALLLAFTAPSGIGYPVYGGYNSYSNDSASETATNLISNIRLTDKNEKITLSLRDSDVKQVLRMFADKAAKNIVFHSSVSGKVTLDLVDMPINDAFELILQVTNLNYYIQNNTLIVLSKNSSDNATFSKQEMMIFPVKYVSAAKVADFINKNVFGMKRPGMTGVEAATVNAATNEIIVFGLPSDASVVRKVIAQLDKEPLSKTFVVNHTTPAEMADMVCNLLLPAHGIGSGSTGGGSEGFIPPSPGVSTGGAAGVVTGGAAGSDDGIKLGEGVVACTVTQSSSGPSKGFDMQNIAISYYPQRGTILMVGGSEAQISMVDEFIRRNDIKQPQAYIEMSIVELNEQGSKEFQNNWNVQSKAWGVSFSNGVTSGGRYGGYYDPTVPVVKGGWVDTYDDDNHVTGSSYWEAAGKLKRAELIGNRSYIEWTMNYLIENQKARVLANPKIIVTNGQTSTIDLTEDYVQKVTSEFLSSATNGYSSGGTVQRTYTIGNDKGLKIDLVPFISPDGYVTLNIKPNYSTESGQIYASNETGQRDLVATLLNRRNLELKNVRIKDGETLVIGGMIQEVDQKTVQKIPVLGDLPLVGAAFRSSSTSKMKAELVIMITPKIINDGDGTIADKL